MIKRKMPLDRWLPLMYSMSGYYADEKEKRFWATNPPKGPDGKQPIIPLHHMKDGTVKVARWTAGFEVSRSANAACI